MLIWFQSRETGIGIGSLLTPRIMKSINDKRRGNKHVSVNDARLIDNDEFKHDIVDDLLLRYLRAGINRDGYWNNSHTTLQVEYITKCLIVIFPSFSFKFLYDQSS